MAKDEEKNFPSDLSARSNPDDTSSKSISNLGSTTSKTPSTNQGHAVHRPIRRGPFVSETLRKLMGKRNTSASRSQFLIGSIADERRKPWQRVATPQDPLDDGPRAKLSGLEDENDIGDERNKFKRKDVNHDMLESKVMDYSSSQITDTPIFQPEDNNKEKMEFQTPTIPLKHASKISEHLSGKLDAETLESLNFDLPFEYAMEPWDGRGIKKLSKTHSSIISSAPNVDNFKLNESDRERLYPQKSSIHSQDPFSVPFLDSSSYQSQIIMARIQMALISCEIIGCTIAASERRLQVDNAAKRRACVRMNHHADRALWLSKEIQSDGFISRSYYWLGRAAQFQHYWDDAAKAYQEVIRFDACGDIQIPGSGLRPYEKTNVGLLLQSVLKQIEAQERQDKKRGGNRDAKVLEDVSPRRRDVEAALRQAGVVVQSAGRSAETETPYSVSHPFTPGSVASAVRTGSSLSTTQSFRDIQEPNTPFLLTEDEKDYINAPPRWIDDGDQTSTPQSVPTPILKGSRRAPPKPIKTLIRHAIQTARETNSSSSISSRPNRDNLAKELAELDMSEAGSEYDPETSDSMEDYD